MNPSIRNVVRAEYRVDAGRIVKPRIIRAHPQGRVARGGGPHFGDASHWTGDAYHTAGCSRCASKLRAVAAWLSNCASGRSGCGGTD
ncbi:hypothetical protein B0T16DRAFT_27852 [Cercophora newfieldiana]|uniref:Uncharacterized protein n=1 Tax=Cercophora newfieldiana TaxID=92897 RepID=A0AA39YP59_9PEZI|nr:hypothetical protein B0T16DRAFT_27852 [Cercophora newfieldiana]